MGGGCHDRLLFLLKSIPLHITPSTLLNQHSHNTPSHMEAMRKINIMIAISLEVANALYFRIYICYESWRSICGSQVPLASIMLYNHSCIHMMCFSPTQHMLLAHQRVFFPLLFLFFPPCRKTSAETMSCLASLASQMNLGFPQLEYAIPFMPCHYHGVCSKARSIPKRQ